MKRENVIWGMLFLFVGTILLLENFDVIDFHWRYVWRLWPLILVITGANMMFDSRKHSAVANWTAVFITVLALGFVAYYGTRPRTYTEDGGWSWRSSDRISNTISTNAFTELMSPDIQKVNLNIRGGATNYKLSDSTSNLFDATVDQRYGNYSLQNKRNDSLTTLSFAMKERNHRFNLDDVDLNDARISLNTRPLYNIEVEMGAGELNFDLSNHKVERLRLKGGAASFKAKLGQPVEQMNVEIETGVSEVRLEVPKNVSCRIVVSSGLSAKDFSGFTKQSDGSYTSAGYTEGGKNIQIRLKGGLSDFEVRTY